MEWVHAHEHALVAYAYARLSRGRRAAHLGPGPEQRGGLVAFTLEDIHPHDLPAILDREGRGRARRPSLRAAAARPLLGIVGQRPRQLLPVQYAQKKSINWHTRWRRRSEYISF